MAERKRIGLLFSVSEGWIGGSYYFLNIIAALNNMPDEQKPVLLIYSSDTSGYDEAVKTGYPYLAYRNSSFKYSIVERVVNKISRVFSKRNLMIKGLPESDLPVLFGYYEQLMLHKCKRKVFWIPDFQEHYYPEFLGQDVALERKKKHLTLIREKAEFVFSSESALRDFHSIYPGNSSKTSVVKFAVTHPDFSSIDIKDLQTKYLFGDDYFFTPNQFWPHKNHMIVLEALALLRRKGLFIQFLFSGKFHENDLYAKELMTFVKANELDKSVIFLGFIAREEQLCIMKNARAVVQPSFFEGWSTVVEDAKAIGKFIVASDLPVHREQVSDNNAVFFDPQNEKDLSSILEKLLKEQRREVKTNYQEKVNSFAKDFLNALN